MVKRVFDILASLAALLVFAIPILSVFLSVRVSSPGPAIFWSKRVGRDNEIFWMPKFRTMRTGAPNIATHLMFYPEEHLTPIGGFLRRSSLDELPQLWCILIGTMSVVGPRPALFNQEDLISMRIESGVDKLIPGLTGWAQIHGRDQLSIVQKVELDTEYLAQISFPLDMKIIFLTIARVLRSHGVSH